MTKILMMGPPASGKTSIRYCFFRGLRPEVVLGDPPDPTYREEERFDHFDFLLRIIDLGGQESFLGAWNRGEKEEELFTAVDALIYVVDAADPDHRNVLKAARILQKVLASISKFSPEAKIHVLLHKMDIVKTTGTVMDLREELKRVIPPSMEKVKGETVAFHETTIVDGTANRALRTIINEAMPIYGKISEVFEKAIAENNEVELIQLLAPRRPEMAGVRGRALVVAEAASPNRLIDGCGVKEDLAPLARRLNEAVGDLGEGKLKYTLMIVETGRMIILKDLYEYYIIMESRKKPDERVFLTTTEHTLNAVKDITKLTRPGA